MRREITLASTSERGEKIAMESFHSGRNFSHPCRVAALDETGASNMTAKLSYLVFGFVLGTALLLTTIMVNTDNTVLSKTSRLNGAGTPAHTVAPADFAMERFG
ncbi:hypothetical protein [Rhizobium herbae]